MARLSSSEVATYLRNFLEGGGGRWDWDDFTSMRLDDPVLENIRVQCVSLPDRFPPTERGHYCGPEGFVKLRQLLDSFG